MFPQNQNVRFVLAYYYDLPLRIQLLARQLRELSEEYNTLHASQLDGMPHATEVGRSVEAAAAAAEEKRLFELTQNLRRKIQIACADQTVIRECLSVLNAEYQQLVAWRFRDCLGWAQIAARAQVAERSARYRFDRAAALFAETFDRQSTAPAILKRAREGRR